MKLTHDITFETTAPATRIEQANAAAAIGDPGHAYYNYYASDSMPVPEPKMQSLDRGWRGHMHVRESGQVELHSVLGGFIGASGARDEIHRLTHKTCRVRTWSEFTGLYTPDGEYVPKSKLVALAERTRNWDNSRKLHAPTVWLDDHHNIAFPLWYMPGGRVAVWPTVDSHPYTQTSWGVQQTVEADLKLMRKRARQAIQLAVSMLKLVKLDRQEATRLRTKMLNLNDSMPELTNLLFEPDDDKFSRALAEYEIHEHLRFYEMLTVTPAHQVDRYLRSDGAPNISTKLDQKGKLYRNILMGIMSVKEYKFLHVRNPRG